MAPELNNKAQHAYMFDDLKTGSLISIGQLCDDDCIAIFSRYNLKIIKNNKIIINGKRKDNGLWDIPVQPPKSFKQNHPTHTNPFSIKSKINSVLRTKGYQPDFQANGTITGKNRALSLSLRDLFFFSCMYI